MRCLGHLGGGVKHTYKILVTKSEGKTPVGISGHSWEDNIILYIKDLDLRI
jgi:hypothetical protein